MNSDTRAPRLNRWRSIVVRALITLATSLAVVASLLSFPAVVPWMIFGWLVWHSVLIARSRSSWPPLAACLLIVLVKRLDWPPGLWVFLIGIAVICAATWASKWLPRFDTSRGRWMALSTICLWLAWLGMAWNWHSAARGPRSVFSAGRAVVCIGDSLTSGISPHGGYVPRLAERLSVPVVDLSQPGITAAEALKRLPELRAAQPQAVVIELGGHDYLKGRDRHQTKAELLKFIQAARQLGATPILCEVPRGFITDPYAGLERELARHEDLELISDSAIRRIVMWSPTAPPGMWTGGPYLSDDGLHPNDLGNEALAEHVARGLAKVFGTEILSPHAAER